MKRYRSPSSLVSPRETRDGAGVRLRRVFGFGGEAETDPFLLLDHFGSDRPEDYLAGFPLHPHRGIETVTYLLEGVVDHLDSLGNGGRIGPGEVQWMTAGSGILHEEMPKPGPGGRMYGFQLWVNLPRVEKLCAPRYRGLKASELPVHRGEGWEERLMAGEVLGRKGAIGELYRAPLYLELRLEPGGRYEIPLPPSWTALVYLYLGSARLGGEGGSLRAGQAAILGPGEGFLAEAGAEGARLLLASGEPLREPIAWRGPIVMNSEAELDLAYRQLREGGFITEAAKGS